VAAWSDHLDKEGYAVLKGVLSKEEIDKSISIVFDWFESLDERIKRDDMSTWTAKNRFPGRGRGFLTASGGA